MRPFPARLTALALLGTLAACEGEDPRTRGAGLPALIDSGARTELQPFTDSGATTAGMTMTDNAIESLFAAVEARGLPVPVPGVLSRAGAWRVMLDTAGADDRLTILHEVAAVAVPDGPVEFIAPVNAFRHVDGRWTDISPATAPRLPRAVSTALMASLSSEDRMYVFRTESVTMSGSPGTVRTLPQRIERTFTLLEQDVAQILRDGFMPASMEP